MDISTSLEQVRTLIRRGKNRKARSLLREIATLDPKNEEMYLLFAKVAEKREQTIYCLEQVIKINPNNLIARSELANYHSGSRTSRSKRLNIGVIGFLVLIAFALLAWVITLNSSDSSSPSEHQLNTKYEETEKKFGYTESERRQIWEDIIRAEDRADVEALLIYPDMTPYNDWRNLFDELAYKYKLELAQKLGLSIEQLGEIGFEGIEKGWPFPPLP